LSQQPLEADSQRNTLSHTANTGLVPPPPKGAWLEVLGVALGVLGFTVLLWSVRGELGMTWDEPYFFERQHDIRQWLTEVAGTPQDRGRALSPAGLERAWRVCREVPDQHPPLPPILSLITGVSFEWLLGPLRAYRLSTVLVMAVAAGVLFRLVRTRWGLSPAFVALASLLFNPRIFADTQQITADSDLGAFWFLSAVAYLKSCESGRGSGWFGVFAGLAIMCKATGVLVLPAMGLWALLYRPRGWWKPLVWSVPLTPLTMLSLNPAWWPAPLWGMVRWVKAFLSYPQKVPVLYLGQVYDSVQTFLPWHNTLVLTAVMVPLGLLILATAGLLATGTDALRRLFFRSSPTTKGASEEGTTSRWSDHMVASWAAAQFLMLMVMRVFHFMPAHDGLRQLVPAFYFFPVLAAYGARTLSLLTSPVLGRRVASWLPIVFVIPAAWGTLSIHPYELAYYNVLIGGPRGAKAAGMESTYFWDSATSDVLDWMNAHLPRNANVLIFPPPNVHIFEWEQRWGRLRRDLRMLNMDAAEFRQRLALLEGPDPCFMIFQMRQGLYGAREAGQTTPFGRLAESQAVFELAPRNLGVRLLAIFNQSQVRAALEESQCP